MGTLDGKVAIITGAGQGLGAAHAKLFAAEGARLVLNDLGDGVEDVVAEINASGGEAVANRTSVSDWNASKEMIEQAVDTYGDLHILVNNAGILRDKMSFNMEEDEWDAVINVHLKGHFCPSRHAGTYWRSQSKAGHDAPRRIINTSSEAGLFGNAGQANYAAAKSGIATLAIVFGRELAAYGVTGNAIAPRARTAMTDSMEFFSAPEDESQFDRFLPENISPAGRLAGVGRRRRRQRPGLRRHRRRRVGHEGLEHRRPPAQGRHLDARGAGRQEGRALRRPGSHPAPDGRPQLVDSVLVAASPCLDAHRSRQNRDHMGMDS